MLHYTPLIIFLTCLFCFHVHAQHRYVVVDMETGVPQRDVRVRWDRNHETHTIWDGSFKVDRESSGRVERGSFTLTLSQNRA